MMLITNPATALAATPPETIQDYDVFKSIKNIADWMFSIFLVITVLFLVLAGLSYVTAQGDPEKIKKAGQSIQWALIGVIVALLAKGLVELMEKFMQS